MLRRVRLFGINLCRHAPARPKVAAWMFAAWKSAKLPPVPPPADQSALRAGEIRRDLVAIVDRLHPRRWTLIDTISGQISRLSRRDLQSLRRERAESPSDSSLDNAANSGLLRTRGNKSAVARWGDPIAWLAIRVPLFGIDPLAMQLARASGLVFSPIAILFWLIVGIVAAASLGLGYARAEASIRDLSRLGGIGWTATSIAVTFIIVKCIHELGHATACRRLGVPVGDVGLFFFCGVPCPYCDVSQIARVDSRWQRAAVMMAGIYVEWIIAAIAICIWWAIPGGALHLVATNTIVLCGISTLVFNANPLMRLDGYYVLSDMIGTPNLRRQSAKIWHQTITARLAGRPSPLTWSAVLFSVYHSMSWVYRGFILIAIATFLLSMLGRWNLWWIGAAFVFVLIAGAGLGGLKSMMRIIRGDGVWHGASWRRRFSITCGIALAAWLVAIVPLRREVTASGWMDVRDAMTVFLPESGWVDEVNVDFGDSIRDGDPVLRLRDDDLPIELAALDSRRRIARLETADLKRSALRKTTGELSWKVDQATTELVDAQCDLLRNRIDRMTVRAPRDGVILPLLHQHVAVDGSDVSLAGVDGRYVPTRTAWCRIGDPAQRMVILHVTTKNRQLIIVGSQVRLIADDDAVTSFTGVVESIDESPRDRSQADAAMPFVIRVTCPTTAVPIGTPTRARIHVEYETLWKRTVRVVTEFIHAPIEPQA